MPDVADLERTEVSRTGAIDVAGLLCQCESVDRVRDTEQRGHRGEHVADRTGHEP